MKVLEIVRVINRGGFGLIEEVICNDKRNYARKTFSPSSEFVDDVDLCNRLRVRFRREVLTQLKLPRELFIPIIYHDLTSDTPWFLMPIADAVYSDEIEQSRKENRLPNGLGDILNSLEHIHKLDLFHRDLKPQNILFHDGTWKLADFGLISKDKEILSQTITTSNNAWGTQYYCAPEQLTEFSRPTAAVDIYSFGAILHDIFNGEKRVPHSELSAEGEIGLIIGKCTKTKKELRFRNIAALRNKLLYTLSKLSEKNISVDVAEWIDELSDYGSWDEDKLESFVLYLKRNNSAQRVIFFEMENKIIEHFHSLNKDLFHEFALMYGFLVDESRFDFDYCDVIIGYLKNMYNISKDLEVKAKIALAAAELGNSHNRWYVMRKVVEMCNKTIDDRLAFRIALEIDYEKRHKANLIRCVEGIRMSINAYHDTIKENLE